MKKYILVLLVLFSVFSVYAAEPYYSQGNGIFTVRTGAVFPWMVKFFHPASSGGLQDKYVGVGYGTGKTNMSVGGVATIGYEVFLSPKFALGGALGYQFNYTRSSKIVTVVPFTVKCGWVPVQTGKFDVELTADIGACYLKYASGRFIAPCVSIAVQPKFFFNENWGLGLEACVSSVFELYSKKNNSTRYYSNCMSVFVPVSLVLNYRH